MDIDFISAIIIDVFVIFLRAIVLGGVVFSSFIVSTAVFDVIVVINVFIVVFVNATSTVNAVYLMAVVIAVEVIAIDNFAVIDVSVFVRVVIYGHGSDHVLVMNFCESSFQTVFSFVSELCG